jgi:hypothetical protein
LLSSKSGTDAVNTPTGSANFANSNVGTWTVTYSYSISGDDDADYTLIQPNSPVGTPPPTPSPQPHW